MWKPNRQPTTSRHNHLIRGRMEFLSDFKMFKNYINEFFAPIRPYEIILIIWSLFLQYMHIIFIL